MTSPGGGTGPTGPEVTSQPPVEAKNVLATPVPPAPANQPAPQNQEREQDTVPDDDAEPEGGGLTAAEQRELARLQDKQARHSAQAVPGPTVKLKVDPDGQHSEMIFGGTRLTTDATELPASVASAMRSAADDAGVTLIQED
jgi:hypothetical protein